MKGSGHAKIYVTKVEEAKEPIAYFDVVKMTTLKGSI
jgi:hypothetical protein